MLGIVQMQEVDPLDPERLQALLERAARARGVEHACLEIAIELGRDDEALGQAAALANGGADPLFAAAHAIIARGVDEIGGPIENGVQRRPGARFVNAVAVGVRHVAEARGAEADGRDHEIGAAQPDLVHDSLGHRELPDLIGAASVKRRRAAGKARDALNCGLSAERRELRLGRKDFCAP